MAGSLRLELLGGLRVTVDGAPLTGFVSTKVQALFCYLAVSGRPHFRPVLAALLWGEQSDAEAATNLRQALANLRRLLDPFLLITRQTVTFNAASPAWINVAQFEACLDRAAVEGTIEPLQAAAELYQGDFLAGLVVRDAPAFEEWALAERERLRERALHALHTLAVQHTARGEYAAGIAASTRVLALDPWREEAHRQLMLLLARSGHRSAALAQY
jgi:DNA-binding SARP family transcriptional activator